MLHKCSADHCANPDATSCYCKRGFPKQFSPVDEFTPDGANILLRRRPPADGGHTFTDTQQFQYTNAHVVSYNKYLMLRFDCHLNVAPVTTVGCIKYLFKVSPTRLWLDIVAHSQLLLLLLSIFVKVPTDPVSASNSIPVLMGVVVPQRHFNQETK
jgi:hypothetical protein